MPRIRTIKPKFWDDLKLSKVSRDARLTFIGMWTFADDLGVVIGEPIWLKSKVFPFDQIQIQQFEKWLTELVQQGFISLFSYKQEKFYYLPNLTKHQVINRPNYDEVNVQKDELFKVLEQSMNNHGTITEASRQERKGKEGKGEEGESGEKPPPQLTPEEQEFEDVKTWMKENCSRVLGMKEPLKFQEYFKLKYKYGPEMVSQLLQSMHNWKKLSERVSAYQTFLTFARRELKNQNA